MFPNNNASMDRASLNFVKAVDERFEFLLDIGFSKTQQMPTIVRYAKGNIVVDVYHGRESYELGFGISYRGTRYSLSELIRASDPKASAQYRNYSATNQDEIMDGLDKLKVLVQRYCIFALQGDPSCFADLDNQRKLYLEQYALDVQAQQLRPQAEEEFRQGHYVEAAELYEKIRPCLSNTELKKLLFAKKHSYL